MSCPYQCVCIYLLLPLFPSQLRRKKLVASIHFDGYVPVRNFTTTAKTTCKESINFTTTGNLPSESSGEKEGTKAHGSSKGDEN